MPPIPPVTKALMLICTAVFCIGLFVPLAAWFALWPTSSSRFFPWQVLSYAFLHSDMVHLFFNMLGLWMFGSELERLWGRNRYLVFLLASLVAAALTQFIVTALLGSTARTVGASGALYGLLLAYALVFTRRQFDLLGFVPVVLLMIPSTIFNIAGMLLFIVMLTNRAALPIRPIPMPALGMVVAFGVIELYLGVLGTQRRGALRAPGRHGRLLVGFEHNIVKIRADKREDFEFGW